MSHKLYVRGVWEDNFYRVLLLKLQHLNSDLWELMGFLYIYICFWDITTYNIFHQ